MLRRGIRRPRQAKDAGAQGSRVVPFPVGERSNPRRAVRRPAPLCQYDLRRFLPAWKMTRHTLQAISEQPDPELLREIESIVAPVQGKMWDYGIC